MSSPRITSVEVPSFLTWPAATIDKQFKAEAYAQVMGLMTDDSPHLMEISDEVKSVWCQVFTYNISLNS